MLNGGGKKGGSFIGRHVAVAFGEAREEEAYPFHVKSHVEQVNKV